MSNLQRVEAATEIPALLHKCFGEGNSEESGSETPTKLGELGAVVVALHACGALSNSCLELCVEAARAGWLRGAMIVGCCYGLLEEPTDWPRSAMMKRALSEAR